MEIHQPSVIGVFLCAMLTEIHGNDGGASVGDLSAAGESVVVVEGGRGPGHRQEGHAVTQPGVVDVGLEERK